MTDPYLDAARAYCLAKFPYDGPADRYVDGEEGRQRHIDYDARSTADEPWLRAVVDAARAPLVEQLVEANATIDRAGRAVDEDHPAWQILDDYDGSMDNVKALVAEAESRGRAKVLGEFMASYDRELDAQTRRIIGERDAYRARAESAEARYDELRAELASTVVETASCGTVHPQCDVNCVGGHPVTVATVLPVVRAAEAWVDRIVDPPNLWGDDTDFRIIRAVEAYREAVGRR